MGHFWLDSCRAWRTVEVATVASRGMGSVSNWRMLGMLGGKDNDEGMTSSIKDRSNPWCCILLRE